MKNKKSCPTAAIVAIGDELLAGRVDTNGPAFAEQVRQLGIEPRARVILPDEVQAVAQALILLLEQHDLILCCGGLGPTQDDITRDAIAQAAGKILMFDPKAYTGIERFFKKRNLLAPEVNRVQAMIPHGATVLSNRFGTAPGFVFRLGKKIIAAVPGPPRECFPMFKQELVPYLKRSLKLPAQSGIIRHYLRTCGIAEARLQELLGPVFQAPGLPELSFLLDEPGEILVGLATHCQDPLAAKASIQAGIRRVTAVVKENIVDKNAASMPAVIGALLMKQGQTLAVAESCTGGLIARRLTSVAGSSRYFLEGVVSYSDQSKCRRLGVPAPGLKKEGAVSHRVAAEMARGIRRTSGADWGIGVTGIAGPGGGSREKPVGLVYLAVAGPKPTVEVLELHLSGERDFIQRRSATLGLDLLRRKLLQAIRGNKEG